MTAPRLRILYLLREYPQISQTYIKTELEAVRERYDVKVLSLQVADIAEPRHLPFQLTPAMDQTLAVIKEFKPRLLHTHYMIMGNVVGALAEAAGLPFTLRSHSFDVLETEGVRANPEWLGIRDYLSRDNCLGVLCFPFLRASLEQFGVPKTKLIDVPPVVAVQRFTDRSPNGRAIMNLGAVRPKKQMQDFVELARQLPEREFNLYALGYQTKQLKAYAESRQARINFIPPLSHDAMPAEYKKHEWLVYTAHPSMKSVGWPMAVAEAQAAGVGVCLADIRPDLKAYVGEAGYLYTDLEKVKELISGPVPAAMREAGFEQAKKSDVATHIHKLTDLWDKAV
ncbi:MAG: glycosyltransferase [Gammaproteobacteria bacterium]